MDENSQAPEPSQSKTWYSLLSQYLSQVTIGVLRLRRVQVSLTTILVTLAILWFPQLDSMRDQLLTLVAAILMVALGGYSVNDAIQHGQPDNSHLEDLLEAVADELGVAIEEQPSELEEVRDV